MIVEAAVFVVDDDQQRAVPLRTGHQRVVDGQNQVLAVFDVGGRVVIVDREAERVEVGERRVDPRHLLQARLIRPDTRDEEITLLTHRLTPGLAGYALLILVGVFAPVAALIGYLLIAFFFLIPVPAALRGCP